MPPTDCFDSSDAASSSLRSCSEPQMQPLPIKRSPLHHGTDPDLSSPTLLPAGVALSGIDLSPLTAGSCSLPVTKRKHRCHMVAAMSSQPSRLSRGLLSDRKPDVDATRAATHEHSGVRAQQQSSSATKSAGSYPIHGSVRDSADDLKAAPAQFIDPRVESNESNGLDDAAGGHPPVLGRLDSSDDGDGSQPSELPRLKPSYSYPESLKRGVCVPRVCGNEGVMKGVNENHQHHHQLKNTSLEAMMAKAKVASDNIMLLLHAKRCDGISCMEPGCSSARQLVEHMKSCGGSPQEPCGDSKCRQAHKILLHYAECRRAFGGRYCLVCSLVARCAGGGAGGQHRTNINTSRTAVSLVSCSPLQGRQPIGYMGPVSAHRRGSSTHCVRESGAWDASGSQPPAAISRFSRRDRVRGTPASHSHSGGNRSNGAAGAGVVMGRFVKDGVFLRPLPKARSGSWGGYDRRRCMRRTRIDSIPEEQAETEEAEDNPEHQDQASPERGSKSSSDMSQEGSHKGKTLLSSLSL